VKVELAERTPLKLGQRVEVEIQSRGKARGPGALPEGSGGLQLTRFAPQRGHLLFTRATSSSEFPLAANIQTAW